MYQFLIYTASIVVSKKKKNALHQYLQIHFISKLLMTLKASEVSETSISSSCSVSLGEPFQPFFPQLCRKPVWHKSE